MVNIVVPSPPVAFLFVHMIQIYFANKQMGFEKNNTDHLFIMDFPFTKSSQPFCFQLIFAPSKNWGADHETMDLTSLEQESLTEGLTDAGRGTGDEVSSR